MTYVPTNIKPIPQFGGAIWYVNKGDGADTNDGETPNTPFETIGAAITAMSDGDAISVKAGTYTEVGLDLSNAAAEMWFEIGVLIDPVSGTALTVSGNSCRLKGNFKITTAAGATGISVTGTECIIEDAKVLSGAIGILLTGSGTILNNCGAGFQTSIAYSIQGAQTRIINSSTVGNGATIGYKINGGADTGVLNNCTSAGHTDAGFYIDTGSADWTIFNCSSGGGDGKWVDVDSVNVWSNFSYDEKVFKSLTFDASGATSANLFKVTGTVLIVELSGHVVTVLAADVGTGLLDLYDGTNTVALTDSPGPSFNSIPVNSFIHKIDDAGIGIQIEDSSQVRLYEDATKDGRDPNFQVTAKEGADSFIRFTYSNTGTDGVIHWHCTWVPLTPDGLVSPV